MKSGLPSCKYCNKILVSDTQINYGFCSQRCRGRRGGAVSARKEKSEIATLIRQYERGEWEEVVLS